MATMHGSNVLVGTLIDDGEYVTLAQVCRVCRVQEAWIVELVEQGVVEPVASAAQAGWRFDSVALHRLRVATRLQHDLGVNPAGAALAIELMEELERLRARLKRT